MALTPLDIVTIRLPALAASAGVATYQVLAEGRTNPTVGADGWKSSDVYSTAVALRMMHMYSIDQSRSSGEAGSIVSKREGEQEIGFGSQGRSVRAAPLDPDLEQTVYGRELLGLMRGNFVKFSVAGGTTDAAWNASAWGDV